MFVFLSTCVSTNCVCVCAIENIKFPCPHILGRDTAHVFYTLTCVCVCVSLQPVSASAAHILGEVCRVKQEAAIPLVRLFLHYGNIVPFLSAIAHAEVNRTQ